MCENNQFIGKVIDNQPYGIPLNFLTSFGRHSIEGLSGKSTLECSIASNYIFVVDDSLFHFTALKLPNTSAGAFFSIFTRKSIPLNPPTISPDIFAGRLLRFVIEYWSIKVVATQWSKESDNFVECIKNLEQGMPANQALLHTWTGRQLSNLGFTNISDISIDLDPTDYMSPPITAFFRR